MCGSKGAHVARGMMSFWSMLEFVRGCKWKKGPRRKWIRYNWQWRPTKGLKGVTGDFDTRRKAEDDGGKKMREPPLACKVEEAQTGRKTERARAMDRT